MTLLFALIVRRLAAEINLQLGLPVHFLAGPSAPVDVTKTDSLPNLVLVGVALGTLIAAALVVTIWVRRSRKRGLQD